MHSSRMHTGRALTVSRGGEGVPAWSQGGVPAWSQGCLLPGGGGLYLPGPGGGVSAPGGVPAWSQGGVPARSGGGMVRYPRPCEQNDRQV